MKIAVRLIPVIEVTRQEGGKQYWSVDGELLAQVVNRREDDEEKEMKTFLGAD